VSGLKCQITASKIRLRGGPHYDCTVRLDYELTDTQAWHLAQFLKRLGVSDFRSKATDDAEAYAMQDAANRVADVLREAGYSPR
jgi:hypothetical protein